MSENDPLPLFDKVLLLLQLRGPLRELRGDLGFLAFELIQLCLRGSCELLCVGGGLLEQLLLALEGCLLPF